mgnify:CR=1 FL=1
MKIKNIFGNVWNSIKAFPLAHILLLILTVITIVSIYASNKNSQLIWSLILSCGLALICSLYAPIYNLQKNQKSEKKLLKTLWIIAPILIWICYFFVIRPYDIFNWRLSNSLILSLLWIFILALIGLFVLIAWTSRKDENKTRYSWLWIIASWFMWWVACLVVWWWIAGALAAIEALFDVYISSNVYQVMWAIVWILISWSFILNYYQYLIANVSDVKSSSDRNSRMRKIFWNYIFFGLTLIYITIFLVYGIKILITWVRPKWIIVRLGIGYFSLWLITTFLIHPQETKFADVVRRWIDLSFLFTSFMMSCAIYQRVNQYGFTMNRFFICAVILLIIIYAILSLIKSKNRRLIFSSTLFVIALLSIYGPVNSKKISLHSQVNRLNNLCIEQNIPLPIKEWWFSELTWDNANEMYDSFDNLFNNYEIEEWNQWFIDNEFISTLTGESSYQRRNQLFDYLDLTYAREIKNRYDDEWNKIRYFNFSAGEFFPLDVQWYSQIYEVSSRDKCYNEPKIEWWCRQEDNLRTFNSDIIVDFNAHKDEIINAKSENWPIIRDLWDSRLIISSMYWEISDWKNLTLSSFYWYLLKK